MDYIERTADRNNPRDMARVRKAYSIYERYSKPWEAGRAGGKRFMRDPMRERTRAEYMGLSNG